MNRRLLLIVLNRIACFVMGATFEENDKSERASNGPSFTTLPIMKNLSFTNSKRMLLAILFLIAGSWSSLTAQTVVPITGNGTMTFGPGDYVFELPDGCSANITYEAWSGGGAGGSMNNTGRAGGGSGAYADCMVAVPIGCGTTYTATVGVGGVADDDDVALQSGGSTIVDFGGGSSATLGGGTVGANNARNGGTGVGCGAVNGTRSVSRSGTSNEIGGAGGSAPSGGAGGAGGADGAIGLPGGFPGGGGGGHGGGGDLASGNGGDGQLIITVTDYNCTGMIPTITFCGNGKATNLTNFNAGILNGNAGTVTWFNRNPNAATPGTVIPNPTCFDLTSLVQPTHLWVQVNNTNPLSCSPGINSFNVDINEIPCIKWTGLAGDGDWENADNWVGGVVPTSSDNVSLNVSGTVTSSSFVSVANLIVGSCTTLNLNGAEDDRQALTISAALINDGCINLTSFGDRGALFTTNSTIINNGTISARGSILGVDTRGIFLNGGILVSELEINLVGTGFTNTGSVYTGIGGDGATIVRAGEVADAPTPIKNPGPTATTASLEGCGSDGFILTDADATILGGQSGSNFILSYHETIEDAVCNTNPLSSPYTATANKQTIFASVIDKTTGCCTTVPVNLLSFGPSAMTTSVNLCVDGIVDLTSFNGIALAGQPGTVAWFNRVPTTGTLITTPTAFDVNSFRLTTHLWAQVSSSTGSCTYNVNLPIILQTDCVTWTGCGDSETWEDGANWSTGVPPDSGGAISSCVKLTNATCPITKATGLIVDTTGYLNIGPGVSLTILGGAGSGAGLTIMGAVDNQGHLTSNSGFNSGVTLTDGGYLNNASCGSISTGGITNGIFESPNSSIFNTGTIESANRVFIRNILSNSGTIVSTLIETTTGALITNSGSINSPASIIEDGSSLCRNPIQDIVCPSITTTFANVCVGGTSTLAGTNGDVFTSLSPNIASIDPTTGVITGIAGGTTCITYTNTTTGCQVNKSVTVQSFEILTEPISVEMCGDLSCININSFNLDALGGQKGNVEWYFGNPNESGVLIPNPTEIDINQLVDVWAVASLRGCLDCESVGPVTFTIDPTECCTNCESATWVGGDTGDWNDPTNWSTGVVPSTLTEVTIGSDVTITGTSGCGIDRLLIGNACVQLALDNGLTVARNCTRGDADNAVNVVANGTLCLQSGNYDFSGGNTCDELINVLESRGVINIAPGVNVNVAPGNSPSINGITLRGNVLNNCGLLTIQGGFTGNGIVANGGDLFNTGNIVIEPVITGIAFDIRNNSIVTNECTASIINNNVTNSDIDIRNNAILFNYGFIRSSSNPAEGIRARNTGIAINLGFFHNTNGTTRFATGTGVVDKGSFTTHDNIKQIILDPDLKFTCSGQNRSCGCKDDNDTIPTMSQWGLFIFLLLLLNLGVIFLYRLEELKQVS